MKNPEKIELAAYRSEIVDDMRKLVEKYRTIFTWDIPDVDEQAANTLILAALRTALENIEAESSIK